MSKTEDNLRTAFAGESEARNKYTFFARVARKEGYHYIAKIFEEAAEKLIRSFEATFDAVLEDSILNEKEKARVDEILKKEIS